MKQTTVIDYFDHLYGLLLSIEATDKDGVVVSLENGVNRAIDIVLNAKRNSNKIMLGGNGGSASVVSHVQNDLCKAVGVRSLVFTEQPLLTALANDDGYGSIFETPVNLWANPGDVFWTVSSSGNSENIVRGLRAAEELGCKIITFSGFGADNLSRKFGDLNFYVKSHMYGYVETAHAALSHFVTDRAKDLLELEVND